MSDASTSVADRPAAEGRVAEAVADRRFLDPHIETLPRPALRALQESRLLDLLPRVYERSALIRATWDAAGVHPEQIRSRDDFFARVPHIDKDMIRQHRDRFNDPRRFANRRSQ
jgi:phenylacetate-CoA ligase